jgi:hypothetical protein
MKNLINFPGLRNNEFLGFGNDVIKMILPLDPVSLGLSPAFDPFKAEWEALSDYFALQRGSLLSNDLVKLDKRRDDALVGIRTVAEGFVKHFNASKKSAAELILATIDKYGTSIQNFNLLGETETLRNLVEDLEGDVQVKNALTLLGIDDWVIELKDANNIFNDTYLKRTDESSKKPDASFVEKRKPAMEIYRKLVRRIEAKDEMDPSPELTKLMAMLDELILKYNQLISNRGNKDDDESDSPDQPE